MAKKYKTPGVYIEEISTLPSSVVPVKTAVPAFIGFTEKDTYNQTSILYKPVRIDSMLQFESIFGEAKPQHIGIQLDSNGNLAADVIVDPLKFSLHHSLRLYFANAGGPCYISSAGVYPGIVTEQDVFNPLSNALTSLETEPVITIIVLADANLAGEENFYNLYKQALQQCANFLNRMVIVDVFSSTQTEKFSELKNNFNEKIGNINLKFGAAYFPYLQTILPPFIEEENADIIIKKKIFKLRLPDTEEPADLEKSLYHAKRSLYDAIKASIAKVKIVLPPSAAMAGIYCKVDSTIGIWKAPANISLTAIEKPMVKINDAENGEMNVTLTGKSVNAIRTFTGKGTLVWGARSLAGNDNDWRYVPIVRLLNWVNKSIELSIKPFVFETNNANTWVKVQAMIENFLTTLWRQGGLQGTKPADAFFVRIGLNKTMTSLDILEGRMIVEIGIAPLKPAEFIISTITIKMIDE